MIEQKNIKWVYAATLAFIILNAISAYYGFYYFNLLPAALLIILLALFALDKLILFTVFLTPLAVNLQDLNGGFGLSLPTEPIIFGIMVVFILKQLHKNSIDKNVLKHPITIAIVINLVWLFITTLTSDLPFVSFKFLLRPLILHFHFEKI